ncbi:hypothetical protein LOTGIDRAFT_154382 [Lottia gigantea]|uniref:MD-2-related lipid-recognition domain-containing protein n=1 Tax=Lottia gigantea TaxID=225164 RepID=V4A2X6_LOTGI|nr:hypothetical protein LOTGIDRAFT_154382 [Lottia gigantea]ESO89285.1 hypothetical protein LOTGIDRAFT_154382 [Lottia gigantea]
MLALILLAVVSSVFGARPGFHGTGNLEWRDCSNSGDSWLKVNKFDISPAPITIPGSMRVTLDSNLSHQLKDAVTMDVVIEKELLGVFTKVVCVKDVGTCHYDDPCHFLNTFKGVGGCPKQLADNGLPCTCPFNPSQIRLPPTQFDVTKVSSEWSFLATGTYHIKISMTEKSSKKVRGCIESFLKISYNKLG